MPDFNIRAGDTSQTVYVRIRDSTTGLAKTGLTFESAGFTCSYVLPAAARAAIALVTTTVAAAWTSGGFVEVDATNCKGLYRLDLPDAAVASGKYTIISIEFDGVIEESMHIPLANSVNVTAVSGDTTAADNLEASLETMLVGTATGGTTSTVKSAVTGHGDDTFIGRLLIFRTGTCQYEAGTITDYDSAAGTFTFAADTWTTSPTTETFVIV